MRKAYVLGVNYYIGLSVLRCLGREGVPTVACDYDTKAYGLKSKYISEKLLVPDYKVDSRGLLDALLASAAKEEEKPLLFPCHDNYVHFMDLYFDELKEYFLFPQTIKGLGSRCSDKKALAKLAQEHGVPAPPSLDIDEDNLTERVASELGYPCIIKPDDSPSFVAKFRKKVFTIADESELTAAVRQIQEAGFTAQVQKIIKGFDDHMHTYDVYVDQKGQISHMMTGQKKRQWPINFGASTFIVQKYMPKLHSIGGPFLQTIGWRGFAEIEFKREEGTDDFYLIEINTRTTNFNSMIAACGINMPYVAYRDLSGDPLPDKHIEEDLNEAFRYRYEDIFAKRAYRKSGQLSRKQIRAQERGYHVTEALFARDDIKPWLYFWLGKMKRLVTRWHR
ncbi:MAG: carboxylate--amine ligase [Eubacteriales bacterium]|nr:carboxylate--amine ligase [Eubacteriales bacterium]